jgi:hypothetical protein
MSKLFELNNNPHNPILDHNQHWRSHAINEQSWNLGMSTHNLNILLSFLSINWKLDHIKCTLSFPNFVFCTSLKLCRNRSSIPNSIFLFIHIPALLFLSKREIRKAFVHWIILSIIKIKSLGKNVKWNTPFFGCSHFSEERYRKYWFEPGSAVFKWLRQNWILIGRGGYKL